MNFFESTVHQEYKDNMIVCGDMTLCRRTSEYTVLVLCDGVGSGIYANIAAITCAERLMHLCMSNMAFRDACCMVAESMHRARTDEIPFAAFSAVRVLNSGQFAVYTYEGPQPILIRDGEASEIPADRFLNAGYEIVGEAFGHLNPGDAILLFSDGVSQAGLGIGTGIASGAIFGIGSEGVAKFINEKSFKSDSAMLEEICTMTKIASGNRYKDDTTLAMLRCREAKQLNIATGPPQSKSRDAEYVSQFMDSQGLHVVCGSTTADIIARQLKRELKYEQPDSYFGAPPEYRIEGIDLASEGAVMLNQVYNIFEAAPEKVTGTTAVERLYNYMLNSDVITFFHGRSVNEAHTDLLFKQIGIRPRQTSINLLREKLQQMGKLVTIVNF